MCQRIAGLRNRRGVCASLAEIWHSRKHHGSFAAVAPHAVASAAADLAKAIHAPAIVAFTSSGTTAARIARKRPAVPILAITPDEMVARRLCLLWGAHGLLSEDVRTYEEMVDAASAKALSEGFANPADLIVVVAGIPFAQAGTTNNLRVLQVGRT